MEEVKILIDELKDIKNWDEDHEEKWDDPGHRAADALIKYEKAKTPQPDAELLDFVRTVAKGQHGELKSEFISRITKAAKELIAKYESR